MKFLFFQNIHTFKMSITDGCVKRLVTKYVRENNLSFVLSVVPENITNHHNLELLTLTKTKITKITNSFNINEVEYRKLISSFVETDCYITEVTNALSFYCSVTTQDVIYPTSKRSSKLKTRPKTAVMISSSPKHWSDERNHFPNLKLL